MSSAMSPDVTPRPMASVITPKISDCAARKSQRRFVTGIGLASFVGDPAERVPVCRWATANVALIRLSKAGDRWR